MRTRASINRIHRVRAAGTRLAARLLRLTFANTLHIFPVSVQSSLGGHSAAQQGAD